MNKGIKVKYEFNWKLWSIDRKTIKELLNKLTIEYELSNKSDE